MDEKYVTVIIDLAPSVTAPAQPACWDVPEDRSKAVFETWLATHGRAFWASIEVVAIHGLTGFKNATVEEPRTRP